MKRHVLAAALLATGCTASVHVDHRPAHPAADPTRPPAGWPTLFSRDGNRPLYDNFGKGGSFTVAVDQQVEVAAWADGDVQLVVACLVRIDVPAPAAAACYKPVVGSSGFGVQLRNDRPQRRFFADVPAGTYTLGVDIEGAATWHVRVFGQGI